MIPTAILNAILALGVIVMVLAPLVWAILTQHRDHPRPAASGRATESAAESATARPSSRQPVRPSSQPRPKPVIGRAQPL